MNGNSRDFPLKKELDMTNKRRVSLVLVKLVLGITFIVASIHKIQDPAAFAQVIYGYAVFPDYMINVSAIIVPFVELFAGIGLITGIWPRGSLLIINGFLVLFIVIIGFNLARGHQFDCGCFSIGEPDHVSSAGWLLVRDAVLLAGGVFVWLTGSERCNISDSLQNRRV